MNSLRPMIRGSECLNQDTEFSLQAMLRRERPLRSDCDEQLLLTFSFEAPVRVSQLVLEGMRDSPHLPRHVRVFVNERNMIFATVERCQPTDCVELRWKPHPKNPELSIATALLPKAAHLNASHITVFVVDNENEEDVTEMVDIDLLGEPAQGQGTSSLPKKG